MSSRANGVVGCYGATDEQPDGVPPHLPNLEAQPIGRVDLVQDPIHGKVLVGVAACYVLVMFGLYLWWLSIGSP